MKAAEYRDGAIFWRGVFMLPETAEKLLKGLSEEAKREQYARVLVADLSAALDQYNEATTHA